MQHALPALSSQTPPDGTICPGHIPCPAILPEEQAFYGKYAWCLDPHPKAELVLSHLQDEIAALAKLEAGWQQHEVATNIFLLSCALLNLCEEALRGPALRLPQQIALHRIGYRCKRATERGLGWGAARRSRHIANWSGSLQAGLQPFLHAWLCGPASLLELSTAALSGALAHPLPPEIRGKRIAVPSPFRRLDLLPEDIVALGRRFLAQCEDRSRPLLLVGLRTSGSYFVPLLRVLFQAEGFSTVQMLTVRPNKGPGPGEFQALRSYAAAGFTAVILDDAPASGDAFLSGLEIARRAGFTVDRMLALIPLHPANRRGLGALNNRVAITLEPESWKKHRLLALEPAGERIAEYYRAQGYAAVSVGQNDRTQAINSMFRRRFSGYRFSQLKRAYAVELRDDLGGREYRTVLIKSVGCGWLGYHAFLIGTRLGEHVPTVLGQRDGMLYQEWVPQSEASPDCASERAALVEATGQYIADRVRRLDLPPDKGGRRRLASHENGLKLLARILSRVHCRACGGFLAVAAIEQALARRACPYPTLIDGRMERQKWIWSPEGFRKVDFEHHGMGKHEVNVVDPAYDIAGAVLNLRLTGDEEAKLLRTYIRETGDEGVEDRLFENKLIAGLWTMRSAHERMFGKDCTAPEQRAFHEQYIYAWDFLTAHAAQFCGRQCTGTPAEDWISPLVVLDIDGVIDRRIFGFPSTTAAGIDALSILRHHGLSVALDTARSGDEVRTYCQAYGLAGGVAELGSYLWDATTGRERILLDQEEMDQLEALRRHLTNLPGVFLDPRHEYSIRAFSYTEKPKGLRGILMNALSPGADAANMTPVPLSALMVRHCFAELGLDRLSYCQTSIDTTITAKRHDKGTGLAALREWLLAPDAEVIAVGDADTDLPMFSQAQRSFAPGHINCVRQARLLGCTIVAEPYQRGFLRIARTLAHPDGSACAVCRASSCRSVDGDLLVELLRVADRRSPAKFAHMLAHAGLLELLFH